MQNGQLQRPKTGNTAPLDRPGYCKKNEGKDFNVEAKTKTRAEKDADWDFIVALDNSGMTLARVKGVFFKE